MKSTLNRVIEIASSESGIPIAQLSGASAVDQDMGMSGDDVTDFATRLAGEFGDIVWQWPWHRFANLSEGFGCLFPVGLLWQLVSWPVRGRFSYPSKLERLELGHIAAVIDNSSWFEQ